MDINVDSEFWAWGPATCEYHTFEAYQLMHSGSRKPKACRYRLCSRAEVDPRPRVAMAQPGSWAPSLQALDPLTCRQGCFSKGRGAASRKGLRGSAEHFVSRVQPFLSGIKLSSRSWQLFSLPLPFRIMPFSFFLFHSFLFLISPNQIR